MIEELKAKLGDEVEKLQFELNVTLPGEIPKPRNQKASFSRPQNIRSSSINSIS